MSFPFLRLMEVRPMGCSGRRRRSSSSSTSIPHASAKFRALGRSVTGSSHILFSRSHRARGKLALRAATSSWCLGRVYFPVV